MPHSTSDEPAREWSSENHPGHQDNGVFLPEYRQAGMFNEMLTDRDPKHVSVVLGRGRKRRKHSRK